ncbi:uncharacterized protein BJ212DRAFT_1478508 [Suillus subaureus]|uniref:CHAT domain-containing protein n=1 Tax=Suillus subaureus TaxID=48587 RepID=A0A9P7EFK3_9AGAM|nr:uncharacterized protein BJ212DRAFT_1478508 [Suillus subaureus]KAG1820393.1 hypothetical protein BJ212DRAFT_1478508 [Suillus subaureus]
MNADRSKEPCQENLYTCPYTPTLSALVRSKHMMKKHVSLSFVVIRQGQSGAGKGKTLLAVNSELEFVHRLIPVTANRTTISGDKVTRAGALEALQQDTWLYKSHFVMKDEHLTLLDIMERDIPHAEFAFLSSCHNAVNDEETPDEVIHLTAGLQFSGFKSVVGTLWEVDDSVCHGLYEGDLGTQLRYTRRKDESVARAEDGFHSYRYVILRPINSLGLVVLVTHSLNENFTIDGEPYLFLIYATIVQL